MKQNNKISVLMAVHNGISPIHLNEALKSLHNQTLRPEQVILVEDGPLDKGLKRVIAHWRWLWQRRLTTIHNRKNMGLTISLNKGLKRVRYPLIARMDSDDISHPQRFEQQALFLAQHPEIDIVGGTIEEFGDSDVALSRYYPPTHEEALRSIHRASPLAHPAVMMRRKIFSNGLRYDERYRTNQDIALWFDAMCAGFRIANLPTTMLYFRRDEAMYRRRGTEKAWSELCVYCRGIRRLHGPLSWRYIYPLARFITRLMPSPIIRWLYRSNLRRVVVQ